MQNLRRRFLCPLVYFQCKKRCKLLSTILPIFLSFILSFFIPFFCLSNVTLKSYDHFLCVNAWVCVEFRPPESTCSCSSTHYPPHTHTSLHTFVEMKVTLKKFASVLLKCAQFISIMKTILDTLLIDF